MDIYVLGSGPTIGHIDPQFFEHKHVIATNRVAERLGLYDLPVRRLLTHTHYQWEDAYPLAEKYPQHFFYTPMGDQGFAGQPGRTDLRNVVHYPHKPTKYEFNVDEAWPDHPNGILVGSTSLHGSMHLACKVRASTIILVGADCGILDGHTNQTGYVSGNLAGDDPLAWLGRWELHLRAVADKLRAEYGVRIHSLNPFVNLNLEGHQWTSPVTPTGAGHLASQSSGQ